MAQVSSVYVKSLTSNSSVEKYSNDKNCLIQLIVELLQLLFKTVYQFYQFNSFICCFFDCVTV